MVTRRLIQFLLITASALAGCGGTAGTPVPAGYPLNPCPFGGEGAIVPKQGFHLVLPGEIVFAWELWHNETPPTFACGAQSVQGAKLTIDRSELAGDPQVNWAATLRRTAPLLAPSTEALRIQLFKVDDAGPVPIETTGLTLAEQYGAMGAVLPGAPVGHYRMAIVSQTGEVLAEGSFQVVD